jgi:hypothetical protein
MLTFETADQKEARRFRIAQFNGKAVTVRSQGSAVTGHVRSVHQNKPPGTQLWTITITPNVPKAKSDIGHPAPRVRAFAGDFF